MTNNMNEGLNYMWPTPILKDTITDKGILDGVVNHIFSNYNSEQFKESLEMKDGNLFNDKYFITFKEKIVIPSFEKYIKLQNLNIEKNFHTKAWITGGAVNTWITNNKSSYSMPTHNHSGSHLSAVFYLLCEEQNQGGGLIMHDPRHNANRGYISEFKDWFKSIKFSPKSGDIIIFPSFLYHNVEPFFGKIRLAMPIDLFLLDE
jgi:hypothetical protein